jgi:hypothetical protein
VDEAKQDSQRHQAAWVGGAWFGTAARCITPTTAVSRLSECVRLAVTFQSR